MSLGGMICGVLLRAVCVCVYVCMSLKVTSGVQKEQTISYCFYGYLLVDLCIFFFFAFEKRISWNHVIYGAHWKVDKVRLLFCRVQFFFYRFVVIKTFQVIFTSVVVCFNACKRFCTIRLIHSHACSLARFCSVWKKAKTKSTNYSHQMTFLLWVTYIKYISFMFDFRDAEKYF